MANLIIRPASGAGNKVVVQDQSGAAVLTTADSGATVANATLTTPTIASMANCTFPAGHVLQVVQGTYGTAVSCQVQTYQPTGLTVDITPSATSSKILVMSTTTAEANGTGQSGDFALFKDSTELINTRFFQPSAGGSPANTNNMNWLDSPSSTSELTYTLKFKATSGSNIIAQRGVSQGTIIVMEISG